MSTIATSTRRTAWPPSSQPLAYSSAKAWQKWRPCPSGCPWIMTMRLPIACRRPHPSLPDQRAKPRSISDLSADPSDQPQQACHTFCLAERVLNRNELLDQRRLPALTADIFRSPTVSRWREYPQPVDQCPANHRSMTLCATAKRRRGQASGLLFSCVREVCLSTGILSLTPIQA